MSGKPSKFVLVSLVISAVISVWIASSFAFSFGKYEKFTITGDSISIPINKLSDGKAHFYKYSNNGKDILFFVAKSSDGSYKAAFDACDSCYKSKKGYEQQGDKMICKNCKQKFPISKLGPNATGGCNPGYLPSQTYSGNVVIKLSNVKNGAGYF